MKKLLLVVDYQTDFVVGCLGFEGAKLLEPYIADRINAYRDGGEDIAFTIDTHDENYMKTRESKLLPIPHCIKGTDGWKLYGKIADMVAPEDKIFYKKAFGSSELMDYLKTKEYDKIELVGLLTNICVISNAVIAKTALPEAEVIVNSKGTKGSTEELHKEAIDVLKSLQVTVI